MIENISFKVDLRCNYKLEGENMYSLKWYRDNVEFYRSDILYEDSCWWLFRYIPTEDPSTTVFVMPGLEVRKRAVVIVSWLVIIQVLAHSTPTHIILNNAVSHTSGVFKCEVSAGPPRFSTASRTTHLQIVGERQSFKYTLDIIHIFSKDLPTSKPNIYGLRSVYDVGSTLNLSCESGPSSPPPDLHWFINGVRMSSKDLVTSLDPYYPLDNKRGVSRSQVLTNHSSVWTLTNQSQLKYPLINDKLPRFPKPVIVKCVAVIKEFYRKSDKARVKIIGRKKIVDSTEHNEVEVETEDYEPTITYDDDDDDDDEDVDWRPTFSSSTSLSFSVSSFTFFYFCLLTLIFHNNCWMSALLLTPPIVIWSSYLSLLIIIVITVSTYCQC